MRSVKYFYKYRDPRNNNHAGGQHFAPRHVCGLLRIARWKSISENADGPAAYRARCAGCITSMFHAAARYRSSSLRRYHDRPGAQAFDGDGGPHVEGCYIIIILYYAKLLRHHYIITRTPRQLHYCSCCRCCCRRLCVYIHCVYTRGPSRVINNFAAPTIPCCTGGTRRPRHPFDFVP